MSANAGPSGSAQSIAGSTTRSAQQAAGGELPSHSERGFKNNTLVGMTRRLRRLPVSFKPEPGHDYITLAAKPTLR